MKKMSIEKRIKRLENISGDSVPGTTIMRSLAPVKGIEWTLAIGMLSMPKKKFFTGKTLSEVIYKAEVFFNLEGE